MMTEDENVANAANDDFEEDDTMERDVRADVRADKLPLNPVVEPDDSETDAIASLKSNSSEDSSNNAEDANKNSAGSKRNSDSADSADSSIKPLFPMPDLRERDDGGAMDFEGEDSHDSYSSSNSNANVSDKARSQSRAEFTTVYDIIDVMESNLSEAKGVLFSADMVKISREDFEDHLSRLKDMLPVQLERASALMREAERRLRTAQTQASSIVATAKSQAAQIVSDAEDRAQYLAGQENVTALARRKATNILEAAQAKSDKLTHGADQYCVTVMEGLKQQLDKLEQDVQAGQRVLEERRRAATHIQDGISAQAHLDDEDEYGYGERNN